MTSKEALDRLHDLALPSSSSETWEHRKGYCEKLYNIIKKDLGSIEEWKTNYHISLAFQEAQKEEMQELRKELDVEKWRGIEYWEDFKKLKKFALHFKSDIQEGLKRDYRRGENIVYDDLLNEFGKSFLNDLLKEILKDIYN